ncbi:heme/hemin ABC transporter substrate-binding protein [Dongia deserti]|uniref:heme/hemin ABC transporter substrate-binding protein n=1 Tax=Dongia deserti TaxID=2268030 RepID=UPI0013C52242|nr:hemin ABC transporter substrate-binding protein [Dongia deserti]
MLAMLGWAPLAQADCTLPVAKGPIISIGGDVTEIVYALGAGDRVIAVDITSRYPEAAQALPQVGYMRQLSAEPILSLSPSLILAIADSGPPQVLDQLRAAGTCLALVPDEHSPEGVIKKVEAVAAAIDRKAEGDALAERLEMDFAALRSSLSAIKDKPRVLFLFSVGEGAPMVGGRNTSADAIITLAGGRNAIEGFEEFKPASSEGIIAAAPDVVLVTELTLAKLGGVEGLLRRPDIAQTPAGKAKRVIAMESLLLLGFGLRTPQAIRDLARALHPGFAAPPEAAN